MTGHHKLIIMRHAKSDWHTDADTDFDRPLAARGKKDAPRMAKWLRQQGLIPDLVISSPALRARETAIMVADKLGIEESCIQWFPEIYGASVDDLLQVVADIDKHANIILLIGHNPGLDELLVHLSADEAVTSDSGKLMTTAAVAVLDYGEEPVSTRPAEAHLEILMRPKELR